MTSYVTCARCGIIRAGVAIEPLPPGAIWKCADFWPCHHRMIDRDLAELLKTPRWPMPTHTFPEAMALLPRHLAPT